MLDWQSMGVAFHCRRCGTPLDSLPEQGKDELWDCPRCRRAALSTPRSGPVEEDEIIHWLQTGGAE